MRFCTSTPTPSHPTEMQNESDSKARQANNTLNKVISYRES